MEESTLSEFSSDKEEYIVDVEEMPLANNESDTDNEIRV